MATLTEAPPPLAPPAPGAKPPRRRGRWTPYLLLLPGLFWLVVFFALPVIYQASTSVQTGSLEEGYKVTWHFATYWDALSEYWPQFVRSVLYAASATVLCLLLGYPLAYLIAFRAGRWRNLIMILVIAPFFTSFLIRTLAWKTILADGGPVVGALDALHVLDVTAFLGWTADDRVLATPYGAVRARRVALGTNVFPSLVRRVRPYTVPVYDYALMTEPLTDAQLASVGWRNRQGLGDSANQFHYFRLSADNRILWGGYDAVYPYGGRVRAEYDDRPETYARLAGHFFTCFPQLEGVRFTHAWGGAIDTCSRFSAFFGTAHAGRVAYAAGYTGLGVGATRFGAEVMLDLLAGERTERTELQMVRSKPLPFPPEPFAWSGIALTKWALARADAHQGRRNLWLRTMDRLGLGFDS
ncbi:hypothetical protein SALBM217S_02976 [Streptomyces griseoloalbus]